ncbi:unnamed protein product [Dovyalis caffra]|uniref:Uncharacterized protein n=1 Tax=Dovyalis caffra TaxID=77055 RepID=A0AAV1SB32_9ROSI|nr:unnamed protein product [Dovyalis caffra]
MTLLLEDQLHRMKDTKGIRYNANDWHNFNRPSILTYYKNQKKNTASLPSYLPRENDNQIDKHIPRWGMGN